MKVSDEQMRTAAALNFRAAGASYPEFTEGYTEHIANGGMNVDDFKIGFAMGIAVSFLTLVKE